MIRSVILSLLLTLGMEAGLNCVVSIPPLQRFVEAIGGSDVSADIMVPAGKSPHSYEPLPSQMRALEKADCYFAVGVEFEKAWLPRFRTQNPRMTIVDLSRNIKKIPMNPGKGKTEHPDPHIWTSPANVRIMAGKIYDTLALLDPARRKVFERNYRDFLAGIDKTDAEIRKILAKLSPRTSFMVFHPSWGYFARDYGLVQVPVELEGKAPKPRRLMRLIDRAKREKIRAVFVQPEFSDKSARLLAKELKIPVIRVSPMEKEWSANLLRLARALAGESP